MSRRRKAPVKHHAAASGPLGISGAWDLAFEDTFDGTSLDGTKWSSCFYEGGSSCETKDWGVTDPAAISVSGGYLRLRLINATHGGTIATDTAGPGPNPGFQFNAGVAEAKIFWPGDGSSIYNWCAWWTTSPNWPNGGENDICEVYGGGANINYHGSGGASGSTPSGYWGGAWHTFSVNRKQGSSDFYWDGVLKDTLSTQENVSTSPHYLVLYVGDGTSLASPVATGAASEALVDYVRVWTPG